MLQRYLVLGSFAFALAFAASAFTFAADDQDKDEQKVEVKDLPKAVVDAVKKALPNGEITEAEKETKDGKVIYEVDVKVGDKTYEVKVSEDGKIISQKEEKPDDEDKDQK